MDHGFERGMNMVSVGTIFTCIVSLLVSVALPLGVLVLLAVKYKNRGMVIPWLLGAAGFFVTQILIRLPILTILQNQSWFVSFSQEHLFLYAFGLAFTAGLFELAGRYAVARILERKLDFHRSLAAGLGHGGIEAIVLIGSAYVSNLMFIVMINTGTYDILLQEAQTAGLSAAQLETTIAQLEMIREQLLHSSPALFLLAGFERILAMTAHAAMSMIVCYGVAHKKVLPCLLICLGIHTMIDLTAGISLLAGTVLSQTAVYVIVYLILAIVAAVSLLVIRELHRRWQNTPEEEVSQ